jgi:membrane protease YdiL (CAAX protease family)
LPATTQPPSGTTQSPPQDLAPRWHTGVLIALIVAVAATGALLTSRGIPVQAPAAPAAPTSRSAALYVQMLLVAWGLLAYVCWIGRPRNALPALLGEGWKSAGRAVTDVALAASGWLVIEVCELTCKRLFATGASASVVAMLPHAGLDRVAWVVVSASVGFSEEVVFRGYLQTQLTAFTGRAGVALLLQAVLFGMAHAEQGPGAMVRLAGYGLALGALARWRRSLVPGILCHVGINVASGLLHG